MMKPHPVTWLRTTLRGFGFKQWFLLIVNIVLVLASLACALGLRAVGGTLQSLTAARRFQGGSETRFAQTACFLPVDGGKTEDDIRSFRQTLDTKLVEQSLEAPENGSLYIDAYSGTSSVTVTGESGGNVTVKAVGVGGDFFYFHPLPLLSGSYIRSDDLMDDLVVLDEEMAWRLYGSTDLAGMTVYINQKPFVVAGVIARETDFATRKAYTGDGGIFLSYSALSSLDEDAAITCYELVMPDPISGYAKGIVTDNFPVGEGDVVENSSRYSLSHLLEVAKSFGLRSMRLNGVIYPYWENAARLTEDYAALLLILAVMLALYPLLSALVFAIRETRRAYRFAKVKVPATVEAAVEKRREERLEQKYKKQQAEEPVREQGEED